MPVYRDYDQAGLDAQYNLRARWPEHVAFMEAWRREGMAVRLGPEWFPDRQYGPTPAERIDLLVPRLADNQRAPILLYIHGGYWQALDKLDVDWLGPAFAARGIAFAALNYALAPAAAMDEIVRQCRTAVAWLWRAAPGYGCDPARIVVAGHSAGGHLAAMMAATDWTHQGGLPAGIVRGACCVSGVYDLEPLRLSYHQAVLRLDARAVARNSPIRLKPTPGVKTKSSNARTPLPIVSAALFTTRSLLLPSSKSNEALPLAVTAFVMSSALPKVSVPGLSPGESLAPAAVPTAPTTVPVPPRVWPFASVKSVPLTSRIAPAFTVIAVLALILPLMASVPPSITVEPV